MMGSYVAQFVLGLLRLWDGLVLVGTLGSMNSDRSLDFTSSGRYDYVAQAPTFVNAVQCLRGEFDPWMLTAWDDYGRED
jgi:hypothetical protein